LVPGTLPNESVASISTRSSDKLAPNLTSVVSRHNFSAVVSPVNDALHSQRDFSSDAIAVATAADSVPTGKRTILKRTVAAQGAEGMQIANGRHCVTSVGLVHGVSLRCGQLVLLTKRSEPDWRTRVKSLVTAVSQISQTTMNAAAGHRHL
jgi:hypothetical protein